MDEKDFTGEGLDQDDKFWLFRPDVAQDVMDARKKLGESQGWSDENWHENPDNLRTLFNELNSKDAALLERLGQASDDSTKLGTLNEVVTTVSKTAEPEQPASAAREAPAAETAAPESAPAPTVAVKKVSLFAKKASPPAPDGQGEPSAQDDQKSTQPSQDPGLSAPASDVSEAPAPAKKGFFARKPPPAADPPADSPVPAAPATGGDPEPDSSEVPAPPTLEELHAEVLGYGADPDNPLTEEEAKAMVADPDFEKKLADAEKEIDAQLAALESDEDESEGVSA